MMIYLLTAIGLSPRGRSTLHIYTQTVHSTIQNKQYIELDAAITVLFISKISSTCFGQTNAHLQERKIEIFYNIWYNVLLVW
jgi:hypothetical protein